MSWTVRDDLIVMTPIVQGTDENRISVDRYRNAQDEIPGDILHVAGGQHSGIIIRKHIPEDERAKLSTEDLELEFSVFLVNPVTGDHKQERRRLRFWFYTDVERSERHRLAQDFFKKLVSNFPKDYVGFIKRVMKLMQGVRKTPTGDTDAVGTGEGGLGATSREFVDVRRVEVVMTRQTDEQTPQALPPDAHDYGDSSSEVEAVTVAHVQEVLEQYYPNGLSTFAIANALRCTEAEVLDYLLDLQERGTVMQLEESKEWIRINESNQEETEVVRTVPRPARGDQPTVAIITALFVEKMAVDAMIDDKRTLHRYKSDGESNVYTLGTIGQHRVVATKLSAIGHSRAAMTAAGSITTRLLGNFQAVEHVLVVGVGGGVAHYTDAQRHVRRGDVVVASAVDGAPSAYVYCDRLEINRHTGQVQGFQVRQWKQRDPVIADICRNVVGKSEPLTNGTTNGSTTHDDGVEEGAGDTVVVSDEKLWHLYAQEAQDSLNDAVASSGDYCFTRPPEDTDQLTLPLGDGNLASVPHPNKERNTPKIHLGAVGAGRAVMKDYELRTELASTYALKAYDGDFDAVVEAIEGSRLDSWAMVRGISDYNDGMRTKKWQAYAALQAAACAKLIISRLPAPQDD